MTNFKVLMHDNKFVAEIGTLSYYGKITYAEIPQLRTADTTIDSIIKKEVASQSHWSKKHKGLMVNIINQCTLEDYILCTPNEYRR